MSNCDCKLNQYGNLDAMPDGWTQTKATIIQLRKLNIHNHKVSIGWTRRQGKYLPTLINAIDKSHLVEVNQYLQRQRDKSRDKANRLAEKYAEYMTDDPKERANILQEYLNNQATGGKACKLLVEGYHERDIDKMFEAYRLMAGARHRHENTDYDYLLRQGVDKEQARRILSIN